MSTHKLLRFGVVVSGLALSACAGWKDITGNGRPEVVIIAPSGAFDADGNLLGPKP